MQLVSQLIFVVRQDAQKIAYCNIPRNGHFPHFLLSQLLQKLEFDSTFHNDCGNAATIFSNIVQCNTPHDDSCDLSGNDLCSAAN